MSFYEDSFEDDARIFPAEKWSVWVKNDVAGLGQAGLDQMLMDAFAKPAVDVKKLDAALDAFANPNRMIGGLPLTHHALLRRDLDTLKKLVAAGANLNDVDDCGYTALDFAGAQAFRAGIKYLHGLMYAGANFYKVDAGEGLSPYADNYQKRANMALINELRADNADGTKVALALGADPDATQYDGLSALHLAVLKLNHESFDRLIRAGADVNRRHSRGESSLAMLWWCQSEARLTPPWYAMRDKLLAAGCMDLFFKTPDQMDARELLSEVHGAPKGSTGLDFALYGKQEKAAIEKIVASGIPLTSAELTRHSKLYGESAISLLRRRDQLGLVFNPAVWGTRLRDMNRAWEQAEPLLKYGSSSFTAEDFNRVSASVRHKVHATFFTHRRYMLPPAGKYKPHKGGQP